MMEFHKALVCLISVTTFHCVTAAVPLTFDPSFFLLEDGFCFLAVV